VTGGGGRDGRKSKLGLGGPIGTVAKLGVYTGSEVGPKYFIGPPTCTDLLAPLDPAQLLLPSKLDKFPSGIDDCDGSAGKDECDGGAGKFLRSRTAFSMTVLACQRR
jgi:hypothetical protein